MVDIDKEWREYWLAEGYSLDEIEGPPQSKKARRRFKAYIDYVEQEKQAKDAFLNGFTLILSSKRN